MIRSAAGSIKDVEAIAGLLMEGFHGKFQALKVTESERNSMLRCLAEHMISNHKDNLLIIRDKHIQGVLFIKPQNWKVWEVMGRLFKELRFKTFLKAITFLLALDHSSKYNEIHIDFITVTHLARGKGIGTKLIELVKSMADDSQHVTLYVSVTNLAAQRLYERLGFQIKKKGTSLVGSNLHGIHEWYFMEWKGAKNNE